jgi:twinkle protein
MNYGITEIVSMMNDRAESIAKMLLPGGKMVNREWCAGSLSGEEGKSLKVCIAGDKLGIWCDFATGDAGDLLDLWSRVNSIAISDAIKEAKKYLGIQDTKLTPAREEQFKKPSKPSGTVIIANKVGNAASDYLMVERKLAPATIAIYKISEIQKNGEPWLMFGSYRKGSLAALKYVRLRRDAGKKESYVEAGCIKTCFGWQAIDDKARTVVICEGEIDAATMYQYGYPALSVPFGGGSGNKQAWVESDWELMEQFETIYLCLDNDTEGQSATEELILRLGGHRCQIVNLPHKDVNECLQKGITKEQIDKCFADSKTPDFEALKLANSYLSDVIDEFYPPGGVLPGFDMPWPQTNFRFLRGEVTLITGWSGHGKSQAWGQVMLAAIKAGEKTVIASLEMKPSKTLKRMVRQACSKEVPPRDEVEKCLNWMSGGLWLFDIVGTSKVDELLKAFKFAFRKYGCRQFVVDSLTKLGLADDDYKGQKAVVEKLCDFANQTGAHIHLVAHARKKDSDLLPPSKLDIKGTGSITDLAFNVWTVHRNKRKETAVNTYKFTQTIPPSLLKELNCADASAVFALPDDFLICDKSRNVENVEGCYNLFYDPASLQLHQRGATTMPLFDSVPANNPKHYTDPDLPGFD